MNIPFSVAFSEVHGDYAFMGSELFDNIEMTWSFKWFSPFDKRCCVFDVNKDGTVDWYCFYTSSHIKTTSFEEFCKEYGNYPFFSSAHYDTKFYL